VLRVHDLETLSERCEPLALAEQDRGKSRRSGLVRAGHDFLGRSIAAHRVDGDPNNCHGLRRGRLERLDLAAAIGAAGRADVVRPLGLVALRALDERRQAELVRRPPLVAARLGGLSLRDGHRGGRVYRRPGRGRLLGFYARRIGTSATRFRSVSGRPIT
jgi:hypothetical protein